MRLLMQLIVMLRSGYLASVLEDTLFKWPLHNRQLRWRVGLVQCLVHPLSQNNLKLGLYFAEAEPHA